MKLRILLALLLPAGIHCYSQHLPEFASGSFSRFENSRSVFAGPRNRDSWLPYGYDTNIKYAVLYRRDGQMLLDSTITRNHPERGVAESPGRLMAEYKIRECMVAGIWNGLISDNYKEILCRELNPSIDSTFSALKDPANTFIAGSGMGGLIPMNANCEYPQVFSDAACLTTRGPGAFETEDNPVPPAFLKFLRDYVPLHKNHKLCFNYGTQTLDSNYKPSRQQTDRIMKLKGYTPLNWMTKEFPGTAHAETTWNTRFYVSLLFLLGK